MGWMWMDGRLGVVDGELASANQDAGPCARLDGANAEWTGLGLTDCELTECHTSGRLLGISEYRRSCSCRVREDGDRQGRDGRQLRDPGAVSM